MMVRKMFSLLLLLSLPLSSCRFISRIGNPVDDHVRNFHYAWFGNPEADGQYVHGNHHIIPHWIDSTWNDAGTYPGGDDIGAYYYPQLGSCSSNDPEIIALHMKQIRKAGISVLAFSRWGEGSCPDQSLESCLDMAQLNRLYPGSSPIIPMKIMDRKRILCAISG